jgi:hypothetical protein
MTREQRVSELLEQGRRVGSLHRALLDLVGLLAAIRAHPAGAAWLAAKPVLRDFLTTRGD